MKGQGTCTLYREVAPPSRRRSRSALRDTFTSAASSDLFEHLRALRLHLARERGVPPYVIFHDTTLRDMAERRPKTFQELQHIYGVGEKKAESFGDAFLDAIRTFSR
jgi:ATP-dependent DNA helicase RecQ